MDTTLLVRDDHMPTPTLASAAVSIIDQDNKTQTPRFSSPLCPLSMDTLMQSFLHSHLVRLPSQSSTVNLPRYTVQTVHFERWHSFAHLKDPRVSSPYAKVGLPSAHSEPGPFAFPSRHSKPPITRFFDLFRHPNEEAQRADDAPVCHVVTV